MRRQSSFFRAAATSAALLFALAGGSGSAGAFDGSGCPTTGAWSSGKGLCSFYVKGTPVTFRGAVTTAPAGNNSIRVWITPKGNPELVLAECNASGTRYPSCNAGFPDSTTATPDVPIPPSVEKPSFDCHVQGTGSGTFYCQSGSG